MLKRIMLLCALLLIWSCMTPGVKSTSVADFEAALYDWPCKTIVVVVEPNGIRPIMTSLGPAFLVRLPANSFTRNKRGTGDPESGQYAYWWTEEDFIRMQQEYQRRESLKRKRGQGGINI